MAFSQCKTNDCKIATSIKITEQYLEIDQIVAAQKWLNISKKLLLKFPDDSQQYQVNSLQSELFYYAGLYQFGLHEAKKAIELAKKFNDSLYLSNAYLMEGINGYEMEKTVLAENSFHNAKNYFPNFPKGNNKRYLINKEYIYNDLAQLKIKTKQSDSAYYYNKKAYIFAKNFNDNRCIANVERTFGELFLQQKMRDSAEFYIKKSITTSLNASIYDTALLGYSGLVKCYRGQKNQLALHYYLEGEKLIKKHDVNTSFQKLFYEETLVAFQFLNDKNLLLSTQKKLLNIEKNTNLQGNLYIQNITDQYINSENKLLQSKINELDKQKNIKILQLLTALFFVLILVLVIILFSRKNRLQKLIFHQKNEISKDLHDDIGSELSSILINSNLLKNYEANDKQKILIDKISNTSFEISQRLNAFIWSLNTDNNNVQNFCEYVKLYAYKFLDGTKIKFIYTCNVQTISTKILNGNSRKNLFFAIKEILNNIIKHAEATQININIASQDKKKLLITIQDNGKGLQETNKFGNGIINIKKRISGLKGDLKIESVNGLKISIKVPL